MKIAHVNIKNYQAFLAGVEATKARRDGGESSMAVVGSKGSGKSRSAIRIYSHDDSIAYIRAKAAYERPGWLLRDICRELGLLPHHSIESVFMQVVASLAEKPKLIIVDEAKFLANSFKLAETVKNINDEAPGSSFCFLLETGEDKLLARFPSFFDRISQFIIFKNLDDEDVRLVIDTMFEVPIEEEAITIFSESIERRMRPLLISLHRLEHWSKMMKIAPIKAQHVRSMFGGKGLSRPSTIVRTGRAALAS